MLRNSWTRANYGRECMNHRRGKQPRMQIEGRASSDSYWHADKDKEWESQGLGTVCDNGTMAEGM